MLDSPYRSSFTLSILRHRVLYYVLSANAPVLGTVSCLYFTCITKYLLKSSLKFDIFDTISPEVTFFTGQAS